MDEQLIALYHRHVAAAFDRNLRLAEFVAQKAGKVKWKYEIASASLVLGPKLKFEAPLLGSHAHSNDSWLWAWSNRNLKLTLTNRALGDLVRVTAHRLTVPTLAHPGFSLEPLLGPELTEHAADVIGTVLGRELEYDAYYIVPEEGHDSTVLVRDDRLKATERYPLYRVLTVFPKVVAALPVFDHRAALTEYARGYGLTVTPMAGTLTITNGKGTLTATFDDHDKLTKIEGTGVATPPVKKAAPKKVAKVAVKKPAKPTKPAAKKPAKPSTKPVPKAKPAAKKPPAKKTPAKKVTVKKAPKPAPKPAAKKR
jgi:hypothetical protein